MMTHDEEVLDQDQLDHLVDTRRTQLVQAMTRRFTNLAKPKKGQQDIIKLVENDDQESLKKAAKELDKIRLD